MTFFKQSDLDELRNERKFLSDVFIEFYFTYLSSIYQSDSILFVPPTISYLVANFKDEDDIEDCVKPLDLPNNDLIFFPVNNGGLHWSLLVYNREFNVFAHHDSLDGLNHNEANELYLAVRDFVHRTESLRYKVEFGNKRRLMDGPSEVPQFFKAPTPRQTNGFDCGLYVMAMAKAICRWFCSTGVRESDWMRQIDKIDDNVGITMRPLVLQLIRDASEGKLGAVSCTIEEERCEDKVEELTSEEVELYQFWADFDDPVDPETIRDDLSLSTEIEEAMGDDLSLSVAPGKMVADNSPSLVKKKSKNRKIPLLKVDAFNDSETEMEHQFSSCGSTSASSSIVEESKPVKDVSVVKTDEMGNSIGTKSDCRKSGVKREYLAEWPPKEKSTVDAKRGPRALLW